MAHRWPLLLVTLATFAIGIMAAEDEEEDNLFDFYNNLVTDLGPFLALFGESMTKQYLSESTTWIDYFIFAMGPIGIITTLISVIRLCGYISWKAFVGRSQEGSAAVEAELGTSTSRDVCELYTHGSIARLLGKPKLLELVYIPPSKRESSSDFKEELQLFRYYLSHKGNDSAHWTEKRSFSLSSCLSSIWSWWPFQRICQINEKETPEDEENRHVENKNKTENQKNTTNNANDEKLKSAPLNPPNLSLNIGIVQSSSWVIYLVAAIGLLLQGGIVVMAGADVWALGWTFDGSSAVSKDAPFLYVIGTVIMSLGLMACAALIGETTQETRYQHTPEDTRTKHKPSKDSKKSRSRLIWLQPNQVIGDQNFDSFAFIEEDKKPIKNWTCSWKPDEKGKPEKTGQAQKSNASDLGQLWTNPVTLVPGGRFEFLSAVSTATVLVGYVLQFTGLRRMKPWVSFTQLGVTVLMSFLRGVLRMQRLSKEDNKLRNDGDLVVGYELDWLAFEIWRSLPDDPSPPSSSKEGNPTSQAIQKQQPRESRSNHEILTDSESFQQLFSIRKRLAHLTGNFSDPKQMGKDEFQHWSDEYIKVRSKAKRLSEAMCTIAETFVDRGQATTDIELKVKTLIQSKFQSSQIKLLLEKPGRLTTQWTMDSAPLEAILGLSMWTLISDERFKQQKGSSPEDITSERIFTLGRGGSETEMKLWFGTHNLKFTEGSLELPTGRAFGLSDLWESVSRGNNDTEYVPTEQQETRKSNNGGEDYPQVPRGTIRFLGWAAASEDVEKYPDAMTEDAKTTKSRNVKSLEAKGSLLDHCSQELFVALLLGFRSGLQKSLLRNSLTNNKAKVILDGPDIRFKSTAVQELAQAFVKADLGSYSEALLCILPALRSQFHTTEFGLKCLQLLVKIEDTDIFYFGAELFEIISSYISKPHPIRAEADSTSPFLRILCVILKRFHYWVVPDAQAQTRAFQECLTLPSDFAGCPDMADILITIKAYMGLYRDSDDTSKVSDVDEKKVLDEVKEHLRKRERKKVVSALVKLHPERRLSGLKSMSSNDYYECVAIAATENFPGALCILLSYGADSDIPGNDKDEMTPLQRYLNFGNDKYERTLL